jgi:hypothetical protein
MKKSLTLLMVLLIACRICSAQTPTPAKVAIGSSYVNIGYVNVNPYLSGDTPRTDNTYYFKLNINTKFTVNEVKSNSSTGAIVGYVITPWNFPDNKTKGAFYDSVINAAKLKLKNQQRIKDSIMAKKAQLKAVKLEIAKDSILVVQTKAKYDSVQNLLNEKKSVALQSALTLDPKKAVSPAATKDPLVKSKINSFALIQANYKSLLQTGKEPDSTTKQNLINATKSIPLASSSPLVTTHAELLVFQNHLQNASQAYRDAIENLKDNKAALVDSNKRLNGLVASLYHSAGNINNNTPDSSAYKVTKESKNYPLATTVDTTDRAARYDELAYLDSWANGWLFYITAKDFSDYCVSIFPKSDKFTWGFLTLPVKMRFDNSKGGRFDFEQNLNFGLTFGDKHQVKSTTDISLNYLAGLSVVSVPLNQSTATAASPTTSTTAISTSAGFMFQYDKFQIGIFLGADFAGSNASKFNYQGKPWLGFAIGVSLFGEGKTTAGTQSQ